jgi:hypothetical protein
MLTFMSRAVLFTALALSAAVTACAPTLGPPPPPPGEFNRPSADAFRAEDFSWSAVPGRGAIAGRLTYKQGQIRYTCAKASVILTPETPWTRRRMTILYMSPERAALPVDQVRARTPAGQEGDYSSFVRRTTCDAADHFSFTGLPDGAWYAITIAKPAVGAGPSMALMRRVAVRGGRVVNVEL